MSYTKRQTTALLRKITFERFESCDALHDVRLDATELASLPSPIRISLNDWLIFDLNTPNERLEL